MKKIVTPKGTRDYLFEECVFKRNLINKLMYYYASCGYDEVTTPLLEYYKIFDNDDNSIDNTYKLIDSDGQVLVLCPECTTPIARVIGSKLKERRHPVKLCYNKNVYRSFKNLYGKQDEFTQNGVEYAGCGSIKVDAEILVTAINALKISGLVNFKIELGHVGIFKSIIENIKFENDDLEIIRSYIENKNITALRDMAIKYDGNKYCELLLELPGLFGNGEIFDRAEKIFAGTEAIKYINYVKKIYEITKNCGYEEYITVDFGLVHHINYYTGIVFRGYTQGCGDAIITGGRYDRLIENFGQRTDAIGFALGLDTILKCIDTKKIPLRRTLVIHYDEGFEKETNDLFTALTNRELRLQFSPYESREESIKYARDINAEKIYFVSDKITEQIL